jgi:cell fate regulator YaaT (PSP1 superfamily)
MGCSGCSSGGCGTLPTGCNNNGSCASGGCNKLNVFNWLAGMELPSGMDRCNKVEVRFKNGRKSFYSIGDKLELHQGDVVAVEAVSGHDVGIVSLAGELVKLQMEKKKVSYNSTDIKKIYRKAKKEDVDKWQSAQCLEKDTMFLARKMASDLSLEMKISDVEYQGDGSKATFYYTAEGRIDFRALIIKLADKFKVRVDMRQIGARQEAGRLGGIGSCGRELCCSTWLTDFRSVSTSAARYQQLSLNPLKLAGQCGKLKCCLNYELDTYMDALKEFPKGDVKLETKKGRAYLQKTDIFMRMMWFVYKDEFNDFIPLSVDRVKEILALNKDGKKPDDLKGFVKVAKQEVLPDYENVVGQDSLTRFDKRKQGNNKNKNRNKKKKKKQGAPQNKKPSGKQ